MREDFHAQHEDTCPIQLCRLPTHSIKANPSYSCCLSPFLSCFLLQSITPSCVPLAPSWWEQRTAPGGSQQLSQLCVCQGSCFPLGFWCFGGGGVCITNIALMAERDFEGGEISYQLCISPQGPGTCSLCRGRNKDGNKGAAIGSSAHARAKIFVWV